MKDPDRAGVITPLEAGETEAALWRAFRATASREARDALFSLYFPFARSLAKRHFLDRRHGDIEFPDLCQLASTGLLEALDRYDPERGVPFKGYAARRISGSIVDGVAKSSEFREQISFRNRVRRERVGSLSVDQAEHLPTADAMQALVELAVGLALGFMLDSAGLHVAEEAQERTVNGYENLVWKDTIHRLVGEVAQLGERDQAIIRRHYMDGLSFEQIGDLLHISKGRVSQLHRSALALLRKRLCAPPPSQNAKGPK